MSLIGPSRTCPDVRVESAMRSKSGHRSPALLSTGAPFAPATVRIKFVARVLPRDYLVFKPDPPVRRDVSRFGKPACLLHPVQRGAADRDDLQDLLFAQH